MPALFTCIKQNPNKANTQGKTDDHITDKTQQELLDSRFLTSRRQQFCYEKPFSLMSIAMIAKRPAKMALKWPEITIAAPPWVLGYGKFTDNKWGKNSITMGVKISIWMKVSIIDAIIRWPNPKYTNSFGFTTVSCGLFCSLINFYLNNPNFTQHSYHSRHFKSHPPRQFVIIRQILSDEQFDWAILTWLLSVAVLRDWCAPVQWFIDTK